MKIVKIIASAGILLFAAACSEIPKDIYLPDADEVREVHLQVVDFVPEDGQTKVSVTIDSGGARHFAWEDSDEIGIFPNLGGYQLGFSLKGQGGQKDAKFDGGGWALKSTAKYSAYYPFQFENRNLKKIPVNFEGQEQDGAGSTAHLGAYTFTASKPTSAEGGKVTFVLDQVGTLVWFKLTLPVAATYTEVSLVTDDNLFVLKGTHSLEGDSHTLTPSKKSSKVTLKLKNVTTTQPDTYVNAYMMVAPTDLTGHSYKLYVKSSDGLYYSSDLSDKNHVFGLGSFKAITTSPTLSEGYNIGIGDWGDGGSISGGAE